MGKRQAAQTIGDRDQAITKILRPERPETNWIMKLKNEKKAIFCVLDFIKKSFDDGLDLKNESVWTGIRHLLKEHAVVSVRLKNLV